jgi:hypothetical protein
MPPWQQGRSLSTSIAKKYRCRSSTPSFERCTRRADLGVTDPRERLIKPDGPEPKGAAQPIGGLIRCCAESDDLSRQLADLSE